MKLNRFTLLIFFAFCAASDNTENRSSLYEFKKQSYKLVKEEEKTTENGTKTTICDYHILDRPKINFAVEYCRLIAYLTCGGARDHATIAKDFDDDHIEFHEKISNKLVISRLFFNKQYDYAKYPTKQQ